jgi:hypothetical protein
MPWTTAALVNEYIRALDLVAEPTAFDASIVVAERDLYARLIAFIGKATVDLWTLVANTPDMVVSWATEMAAAYYYSTFQGYHLQPEIPNNEAAVIYDRVLRGIESAKFRESVIVDVAGSVVGVAGIPIAEPEHRYLEELPLEQGGFNED